MSKPLISLIVPVYNVESYLPQCLNSISEQTYKNLEVILVDDGSTDNSGRLCDIFAKATSHTIVRHQKNSGLSAARNTGLDLAKGKYVTFLDSDDFIAPDYIEYLYELVKNSNAIISICSHYERKKNGELKIFTKDVSSEIFSIKTALRHMLNERGFMLSAWGKLYRRDLFEVPSKIRFEKNKLHEDVGTTYRPFLRAEAANPHAKIAFGATPKYYYNLRNNSITNRGFNTRKLDLITQTDTMCDAVDAVFSDLKNTTNLRRLHARFSILRQAKNEKLNQSIADYIKTHQDWILENPEATKRDKLALISLRLGVPAFKTAWKIYELFFK